MSHLTAGRLLARNAVWNLSSMAVPLLVALVAIPLLIDGMGKERFGLLAIIWMGVGYFSLFDLGLGRALTKLISERLGRNDFADLGGLIWTAFILLAMLGVLGASLLISIIPLLVGGALRVPESLYGEAVAAFRILAAGIPIVILTAGLVGILEAHQRFRMIALIRIPLGVLTFAGPLISLQFTPSIAWATFVLLVSRLLALGVYYLAASQVREELRTPGWIEQRHIRPLLSFGGWLTVTNIVGPLLTYLDRFFISAILGLSAVTYYVTPYDILARMQVLTGAMMGVLFPAMATAHGGDVQRLSALYTKGSKVIYWIMLPILAGAFLLGPEALSIWLGDEFRAGSSPVVHWLAAGWIINVLAQPAFAALQAAGRPDLTAKTHLAELLPYMGALWWLAGSYGVAGVAAAWTLRVAVDTLVLNILAARQLPALRRQVMRTMWAMLGTIVLFAALSLLDALQWRLIVLGFLASMAAWVLRSMVGHALKGRLSLA